MKARFCVARLPNAVVGCPAPPPRWPFVRPSGNLAAGGFGGQWPAGGQAFAAGGFGGAGQPPTAPTHPAHPSAIDIATRDDLTRNLAQLEILRIFAAESAQQSRGKVSLNSYLNMATMQGITGKLSGKMGSAVFRVREGQQVVTQYNPIVKNPNTASQQDQRAKFKLMSQLAAVMASGIGTLSVTKRKSKGTPSQRNAFTSLNFPLVTVTNEGQDVKASIPMEQLKLTSSFINLPAVTLTAGNMSIQISMTDIQPSVTTLRAVLIGYHGNVPAIQQIVDIPVNSEHASARHTVENLAKGDYTVLTYGLIPSESAKSKIDIDNIHTSNDENFVSSVELNAMVAEGSMAETQTVGANISLV